MDLKKLRLFIFFLKKRMVAKKSYLSKRKDPISLAYPLIHEKSPPFKARFDGLPKRQQSHTG
jgi:hypothetical protein